MSEWWNSGGKPESKEETAPSVITLTPDMGVCTDSDEPHTMYNAQCLGCGGWTEERCGESHDPDDVGCTNCDQCRSCKFCSICELDLNCSHRWACYDCDARFDEVTVNGSVVLTMRQ